MVTLLLVIYMHTHTHMCAVMHTQCLIPYHCATMLLQFNDTESKNMQYVARERQKMSVSGQ